MSNVNEVFTKNQLKGILFILRKTERKYPDKYSSILALLKKAGFLYINGNIVADPDFKEELQ